MTNEEIVRRLDQIARTLCGHWDHRLAEYLPSNPIGAAAELGQLKGELLVESLAPAAAEALSAARTAAPKPSAGDATRTDPRPSPLL